MSVYGQTCTFSTGGTSISAYCEAGCCNDSCCGESSVSAETIAIYTCATIGGLLGLLLMALLIYCCMRRHCRVWCQWCGDEERAQPREIKRPKPKPKPKIKPKKEPKIVKNKEEKIRTAIKGKWDWHGWQKQAYGEDCKATQTGKTKALPGDVVLPAKSRWFPVQKNKDYIEKRTNIREIGIGTDHVENYKIPAKKVTDAKQKISAVEAFKAAKVTVLPMPKEVRPAPEDRGVSPSMVKPYEQSSARTSDEGYYTSKGKSMGSSPVYIPTSREDTSDSLANFTKGMLNDATRRGDMESPLSDPGREARDHAGRQQRGGYTATWQFPEVKRWNPHSTDKKQGGQSKWDKAHSYAKNVNSFN